MRAVEPEGLGSNPASASYLLISLCPILVSSEIKRLILDVNYSMVVLYVHGCPLTRSSADVNNLRKTSFMVRGE